MYNPGYYAGSNGDGSRSNSNYQPSSSLLQQQLAQQSAQKGINYEGRAPPAPMSNQNQLGQPQYSQNNLNSQFNSSTASVSAPPSRYQASSAPQGPPEIAALMNGLDNVKFAALDPSQQEQIKAFVQAQSAHKLATTQQSSLGLGYPSGPGSTSASTPSQAQHHSAAVASFMRALHEHLERKGTPLAGPPMIAGRAVDLYRMYQSVSHSGGYQNVGANGGWKYLLSHLGFEADKHNHPESTIAAVAQLYFTTLASFEIEMQGRPYQLQQRAVPPVQNLGYSQSPQVQHFAPALQNRGSYPGQPQSASSSTVHSPYGSQPSPRQMSASIPQQLSRAPTPSSQQGYPINRTSMPPPGLAGSPESDRKGKGREDQYLDLNNRAAPIKLAGLVKHDPDYSPAGMNSRSGRGHSSQPSTSNTNSPIPLNMIPSNSIPNPFDSKLLATSNGDIGMSKPRSIQPAEGLRRQQSQGNLQLDSQKRLREESIQPGPRTLAERKRNAISYVPIVHSSQTIGGFDVAVTEERINRLNAHKSPRIAHDLGHIDLNSLTMSIKSRLASEVTFALNSLLLISISMRLTADSDPTIIHFPLANCGDLLEELIELLEESAFGITPLEIYDQEIKPVEQIIEVEVERTTYRKLFRIIALEETELRLEEPTPLARLAAYQDEGACPLPPIELVLAITNLLRNFSMNEENAVLMARHSELLPLILKISELPLSTNVGPVKENSRWPLKITPTDLMVLKKDTLEILSNMGQLIHLQQQSDITSTSLFHLLLFFISEANHKDQLYFDLMGSPTSYSNTYQPVHVPDSHYLDLVIGTFARVTVLDANREILGRLIQDDLSDLFESLIQLLPITESDFRFLTSEGGLVFMENLAMSLHNLAFLSPPSVKLRLRAQPSIINGIVRVIRRLSGNGKEENAFTRLSHRCISILKVLSELGGVKTSVAEIPWYGMGMQGEEDDVPTTCQPIEADRGTVRARLAPSSAGITNTAPPVLMNHQDLYDLTNNPLFPELLSLLDGNRDQ